ncbi:unnamed protein product [Caenorhabditis auriculariae]|uniref:Uncharacterized protein n=1 Tax=Caenorhabditis auriculariae TaxID=2777116 RepID=A0A8S1HGH1_9PELO|nr:unnamed protein product [Caenorhabditis auriculariae]
MRTNSKRDRGSQRRFATQRNSGMSLCNRQSSLDAIQLVGCNKNNWRVEKVGRVAASEKRKKKKKREDDKDVADVVLDDVVRQ